MTQIQTELRRDSFFFCATEPGHNVLMKLTCWLRNGNQKMTKLHDGRLWFDAWKGRRLFFATASRMALQTHQASYPMNTRDLSS